MTAVGIFTTFSYDDDGYQSNTMKTRKKNKGKLSLHLSPPVVRFAKHKAAAQFEGNISLYVRGLIKQDMEKVAA